MARGFLMLARDGTRVVGVAYVATILSAEHCGPVAWLEELYVPPDCRHRGIGTALVTAVLDRAKESGIVAVEFGVCSGHAPVLSLFSPLRVPRFVRSREGREV